MPEPSDSALLQDWIAARQQQCRIEHRVLVEEDLEDPTGQLLGQMDMNGARTGENKNGRETIMLLFLIEKLKAKPPGPKPHGPLAGRGEFSGAVWDIGMDHFRRPSAWLNGPFHSVYCRYSNFENNCLVATGVSIVPALAVLSEFRTNTQKRISKVLLPAILVYRADVRSCNVNS